MSRQTTAGVRDRNKEVVLQQSESDSPALPVAQLEKLHNFRPDIVDWVKDQTQIEAEHRRSQNSRINRYVFIERIVGQVFAFLIGIVGVLGGGYVAMHNQPGAGATISTAALTGLAVVFVTGRNKNK